MAGIRIDAKALKQLGAVKQKDDSYCLNTVFCQLFWKAQKGKCNDGGKTWSFWMKGEEDRPHHVTHLSECLGMVFHDGYDCGKEEKEDELIATLGVKRFI